MEMKIVQGVLADREAARTAAGWEPSFPEEVGREVASDVSRGARCTWSPAVKAAFSQQPGQHSADRVGCQ